MNIEIVYALPHQADVRKLQVNTPCTVNEAIQQSGILLQHTIDLTQPNTVGIFGQIVPLDRELIDNDRIEIYRPLMADPKEIRRRRAKERK